MKLVSWNVNGIRAAVGHGFIETFNNINADVFCLQETKLQAGQIELDLPGYHQYWNYAERKGYSGTAVFSKSAPLSVNYGIDNSDYDHEGRVITLEFPTFYILTSYTPNSGTGLKRLDFRHGWNLAFQAYVTTLQTNKPVIMCGDLNVAHHEIDIAHPANNHHNAGFTDEERTDFDQLLAQGFTDTFRHFYPDQRNVYSWWSYRANARASNSGWRIDYFLASSTITSQLLNARILTDVTGSDHCPVELDIMQIPAT